MKIAILSNVNLNYVIRLLSRTHEIYQTEGYGNELGILMNRGSSYHGFNPQMTFLVIDVLELISHTADCNEGSHIINDWFESIDTCIEDERIYYISDCILIGQEKDILPLEYKENIVGTWNKRLFALKERFKNVRVFPYADILNSIGHNNLLSFKTWYLGKILIGMEAQKLMAKAIDHIVLVESRISKKLLVLDLDNTLWGGLAGEHNSVPIELSEDHSGLIYKDCQRIIKLMKQSGVMLAIASKNNEKDALEIIDKHPHMVLKSSDFVAKRINWNSKDVSLREIAEELNIGTHSFVFWDDNPVERELIRQMLPEVEVPEFPNSLEEMPSALVQMYYDYFEKPFITREDKEKTEQYSTNVQRNVLKHSASSYEDYLRRLNIIVIRESSKKHKDRILQLCNKTNQFNLTTKRFLESEIAGLLVSETYEVFSYRVKDKFGDSGLVAVVIASINKENMQATIEEFAMSCRVMGRLVEYAILSDVEKCLREKNVNKVIGLYLPTEKNQPVKDFYSQAGYDEERTGRFYHLLNKEIDCKYIATIKSETEAL